MPTLSPDVTSCNKRGQELLLYYNVGDDDSQVWVEHKGIIGDMTLNETEELNQQSVRSVTRTVLEYTEGEIELSVNGTQIVDPEYEGFAILNSMRREGDPQDIMVLTGPIAEEGNIGWRGFMLNSDRTLNGPETGAMTQNFNLQPAACTEVPVRPVEVVSANTIANFDPGDFVPVSST